MKIAVMWDRQYSRRNRRAATTADAAGGEAAGAAQDQPAGMPAAI